MARPAPLWFALCLGAVACVTPGSGTPDSGASGGAGQGGSGTGTAGTAGGAGTPGRGGANAAGRGGGGGSGAAGTGGAGVAGTTGAGGASAGAAGGTTGAAGGATGAAGAGAAITIPGMGACTAPRGARLADADAGYAKWKTEILTSNGAKGFLRTRRPNSSGAEVNSTVSEGIAYGMLLSVYAGDRETFDALWRYSQEWLDANGLMHWYINAAGTQVLGMGAASDSDEDIAFALIMADERWGSSGGLNYLELAKKQIGLIWQFEIDHSRNDVLKPGDQFNDGTVINISYFAPAYYRAFGRVTGKTAEWDRVVRSSYDALEKSLSAQNGNASNGLVPAWSTPAGMPMAPPGTSHPTHHQLDSCRTPFRIAQDYCWNAEPRALAYLQKINGFNTGVGAATMVDGYNLDGTPRPEFVTTGGPRAASFVGGAGVGAMATGAAHATLRDDAYTGVATLMQTAGSLYYQYSWTALSLQMMTGVLRPTLR